MKAGICLIDWDSKVKRYFLMPSFNEIKNHLANKDIFWMRGVDNESSGVIGINGWFNIDSKSSMKSAFSISRKKYFFYNKKLFCLNSRLIKCIYKKILNFEFFLLVFNGRIEVFRCNFVNHNPFDLSYDDNDLVSQSTWYSIYQYWSSTNKKR